MYDATTVGSHSPEEIKYGSGAHRFHLKVGVNKATPHDDVPATSAHVVEHDHGRNETTKLGDVIDDFVAPRGIDALVNLVNLIMGYVKEGNKWKLGEIGCVKCRSPIGVNSTHFSCGDL